MAKKPAVWTTIHQDDWAVKTEGSSRAHSVHKTQSEANKVARQIAINNHCGHKIQGRDGKIVNSNSYGNNPCPPKEANSSC
jgi:hypothetical protein